MKITKISSFTGKVHTREIDVTDEQLRNWREKGMLIQDAMPQVSDEDREFILTGTTPEEWNEAFPDE